MENKDNTVYLRHIMDRIEKIERYLQGYDREAFLKDDEKVDAIIRNVEVIGEAANNLTHEFRSEHAHVEWRKIIGARNVLIHGYTTVDPEIIWTITEFDIPVLKTEIKKLLDD